jgi:hypothetical protein
MKRQYIWLATLFVVLGMVVTAMVWKKNGPGLPADLIADLRRAPTFELLTLDYRPGFDTTSPPHLADGTPASDVVHRYAVLGRAAVADAAMRDHLLDALNQSVKEGSTPNQCFNPRHAIHASVDGKEIDILICFECKQYERYVGDTHLIGFMSRSAQGTFEQAVKALGLPEPSQ